MFLRKTDHITRCTFEHNLIYNAFVYLSILFIIPNHNCNYIKINIIIWPALSISWHKKLKEIWRWVWPGLYVLFTSLWLLFYFPVMAFFVCCNIQIPMTSLAVISGPVKKKKKVGKKGQIRQIDMVCVSLNENQVRTPTSCHNSQPLWAFSNFFFFSHYHYIPQKGHK